MIWTLFFKVSSLGICSLLFSDDLNAFKPIRVLFGRHETQPDHVTVEAKRIRITMPHPKMPKEIVTLTIGQTNIIKVICHLDVNPTLVIRVQKECMENIHKQLHIEENTSQGKKTILFGFHCFSYVFLFLIDRLPKFRYRELDSHWNWNDDWYR